MARELAGEHEPDSLSLFYGMLSHSPRTWGLTPDEVLDFLARPLPSEIRRERPKWWHILPLGSLSDALQALRPVLRAMCQDQGIHPDILDSVLEKYRNDFRFLACDQAGRLLSTILHNDWHPAHALFREAGINVSKALAWLDSEDQTNLVNTPSLQVDSFLFHLRQSPVIQILYWSYGRLPPETTSPGSSIPELILGGIRQPKYQTDFAHLKRAIMEKRNLPVSQELSPSVTEILKGASDLAIHCNVIPQAIHLTWLALQSTDEWTTQLKAQVDMESLSIQLDRELFGSLSDHALSVDGLQLGQSVRQLAPLSRDGLTQSGTRVCWNDQGLVTGLEGTRLSCGTNELLHSESRYHHVEELLGLGRVGRWLELPQGRLRITVAQGCLELIQLSR